MPYVPLHRHCTILQSKACLELICVSDIKYRITFYNIFGEISQDYLFNRLLFRQAALQGKPLAVSVTLMDGLTQTVAVDAQSTSKEVCEKVARAIGLRDRFGFSLYISMQNKVYCRTPMYILVTTKRVPSITPWRRIVGASCIGLFEYLETDSVLFRTKKYSSNDPDLETSLMISITLQRYGLQNSIRLFAR